MKQAQKEIIPISWLFMCLRRSYGKKKLYREQDLIGLLIRTILSQNTNDRNRDLAYGNLKKIFPRWEDLLNAKTSEIEKAIKSAGLAHQKALRLKQILQRLYSETGSLDLSFLCQMTTTQAREYLLSFTGIGDKTSAIMLLFGCGKKAFPVDTHIFRVCKRLGLLPETTNPTKAHQILGEIVPRTKAYELHLNLIEHGRKICKARKPNCPKCPLNKRCLYYNKRKSLSVPPAFLQIMPEGQKRKEIATR